MKLSLKEIKRLKGKITLKSGLHIGSGDMEMHIGGTDSPVTKHPHTLEPYIPGSSLKGKVRSLMELFYGLVPFGNDGGLVTADTLNNGEVKADADLLNRTEAILKIFGSSGSDSGKTDHLGPTRVSFADSYLDEDWKKKAEKERWSLTEVKSENSINRVTGTALSPRFIERVPAGTEFSFSLSFKILQDGDEELFDRLLKGLKLLEADAIGGSGSRGYGRIEFSRLSLNGEDIASTFNTLAV